MLRWSREVLHFMVCTALLMEAVASSESDVETTTINRDTVSFARSSPEEEYEDLLPEPSALVSPQSSKITGLFGGKPFYLEKDPITGVVDFNTKTVKINRDRISTGEEYDNSKVHSSVAIQSDHKDTNIDSDIKPSNIIPYKNFPGNLNDFTNLRVQDYSNHKYNSDKFPLISSSYANTKVQGTSGSNKNHHHQTFPTSSTPHPFYYTMNRLNSSTRTTSQPLSTARTTTTTSTTTTPNPTTTTIITTNPTTTTTTTQLTDIYDEYEESYEDSQEQNEHSFSSTGQDYSVHYGGSQIPPGTAFSSVEQPGWINSARPQNTETETSSSGQHNEGVNTVGLSSKPNTLSQQAEHKYGANYDGTQNNAQSAFLPKEQQQFKNNSSSSTQIYPDKTSAIGQNLGINSTGLHNIPSPNLQLDEHFEELGNKPNKSNYNTNYYAISGLHHWNGGVSDKHDSTSDSNRNPASSDYDETDFEDEVVEYENEEDAKAPESHAAKPLKHGFPPLPGGTIDNISSEPPFRFTTSTVHKYATSVRPTQPTTSQGVGKLPTSSVQPPSSVSFSQSIVTSMPLGTHFQFKKPPQQATLPRQPALDESQKPPKQKQSSNQTPGAPEQSSGYLQNLSTNVVVGAGIHEIGPGSLVHDGQNLPAGGHFVSTAVKTRPYDAHADEPFKPVLGPFSNAENVQNLNGDANVVVGGGIGVGSGDQFFSQELPSRPRYPSAGGSSSLLKFPNHVSEKHQPQKINGAQPPLVESSVIPGSQQFLGGHVVFPEDKPILSAKNELVTSETEVTAEKSTPPNGRPLSENAFPPKVTNQPSVSHTNKLTPGRETIQTPSPYLVPPAKPETMPSTLNWDARPKFPSSPQNYFPQQTQKARPKVDTVMPNTNISPSRIVRPNQNGGRRPGIQNNLPNILPQFRPNTKNSHGQVEHGVRIHQFMQQRPQVLGQRRPIGLVEDLQPPPPPPHIRINRHDEAVTENSAEELFPFDNIPPTPPIMQGRPLLVHRRTDPHNSGAVDGRPQVATLQMMQSRPLSRRDDFPDAKHDFAPPLTKYHSIPPVNVDDQPSDHPVFVVYPVNSAPVNIRGSTDSSGVVVGTRGPQLPLPPSNLETEYNLPLGVDDDSSSAALIFAHNKDQEPLLQLPKDKHDTPILKSPSKSNHYLQLNPLKTEFPYPLEKPNVFMENSDKKSDSLPTGPQNLKPNENLSEHTDKHNNMPEETFQAEVYNSDIGEHEDNANVNVIPYLQDFMPYATKKPYSTEKFIDKQPYVYGNRSNGWTFINRADEEDRTVNVTNSNKELSHSVLPISVTLKTVQPSSTPASSTTAAQSSGPFRITDNPRPLVSPPSHQHVVVGAGGSEFTLSAVVHTQPHENHRPADLSPPSVSSVTSPPPLNFQAPFMASANIGGAPTNQGWSVVGTSLNDATRLGTVDRVDLETGESSISSASTERDYDKESPNFDIENFKPQLFGGFKPIYTYPEDDGRGPPSISASEKVPTSEREEKKL